MLPRRVAVGRSGCAASFQKGKQRTLSFACKYQPRTFVGRSRRSEPSTLGKSTAAKSSHTSLPGTAASRGAKNSVYLTLLDTLLGWISESTGHAVP